jgi:hypothetical protein
MEIQMENRKIVHEIKLQKSVIIILGVMAFGIIGITFKGYVTSAEASLGGASYDPIYVKIVN